MTVLEQLQEQCNCLKEVTERDVDELVNLVSNYTCWAQSPCETFLTAERKEVVEVPPCADDCDVFIFTPFYYPFDVTSFTFTLVEQNGVTETTTTITDYAYSEVDENFRLDLGLPDCKCKPRCGCESTYKLLVTYTAGYDLIPDCLVPLFCEMLSWIYDKNNCDCVPCEVCNTDNETGTIDYTTISGQLKAYFLTVLLEQYKRELALISLCVGYEHLWGFRV